MWLSSWNSRFIGSAYLFSAVVEVMVKAMCACGPTENGMLDQLFNDIVKHVELGLLP